MGVKSYQELKIWQNGIELTIQVYKFTENLPPKEKFGLISQMQRASVSVPANIAEGWSRSYTKEFIQFLRISLGSLAELETMIILCQKLNYCEAQDENAIRGRIGELQKMIYATIKTLSSRLS